MLLNTKHRARSLVWCAAGRSQGSQHVRLSDGRGKWPGSQEAEGV